ncbi:hypothetical protein, partial [Burkholderia sp. BCC1638]|uniref:hypothetical protein n=1 Tax=Burkholderia sp. BCC1638 TaxID=2681391 RepID=UPI001ABBC544
REIRCILGANFSEWAALRFGIRPFPAHIADHLARSPINQCFPSGVRSSANRAQRSLEMTCPATNRSRDGLEEHAMPAAAFNFWIEPLALAAWRRDVNIIQNLPKRSIANHCL